MTLIDLDKSGPSAPFTAVIFPDNFGNFRDLQKLQNQDVEVSGTIQEYLGKPEIILEGPEQIKVADGK